MTRTPAAGRGPGRRSSTARRRSLSASVAVVLALGLIAGLWATFAPGTKAETTADTTTQVQQGRALFLVGCATCHGLNGQGSTQAPSLIGTGSASVDFQVGSGRMPLQVQGPQAQRKPVRYVQADIDKLGAYVDSLGPGPKSPTEAMLDTKDANRAVGGELFRTNCASCHNFAGKGGALTYGKYAPSLGPSSPRIIYTAMLHGPENMPVFGDRAITPDEKRDIIAFIRGTQAEPDPGGNGLGRLGPIPEGLVAWFIGIGAMIMLTLWIGARA